MWLLFEAGILFSRFFVPAADDPNEDALDVSEDLSSVASDEEDQDDKRS